MHPPSSPTVAVVGLGYVGLPLVVEFGKTLRTDVRASTPRHCASME